MDSLLWTEMSLKHFLKRSGCFILLSKLILKRKVLWLPLLLFSMLTIDNTPTNHVNITSCAIGFTIPFSAMCNTREKLATN